MVVDDNSHSSKELFGEVVGAVIIIVEVVVVTELIKMMVEMGVMVMAVGGSGHWNNKDSGGRGSGYWTNKEDGGGGRGNNDSRW